MSEYINASKMAEITKKSIKYANQTKNERLEKARSVLMDKVLESAKNGLSAFYFYYMDIVEFDVLNNDEKLDVFVFFEELGYKASFEYIDSNSKHRLKDYNASIIWF